MDIFIGDRVFLKDVERARGFLKRLQGLMFRRDMKSNSALFISGCNWIHTLFMRFPITVVYLDADYSVIDVDTQVKPWRICMPRFKASHVLELKAGSKESMMIAKGEVLTCTA